MHMRNLLKLSLVSTGLVLLVIGGYLVAVGLAYSTSYGLTAKFEIPHSASVKNKALELTPQNLKRQLDYKTKGLLYSLGGGGGILALIGFIFILNGIFRFNPDKHKYSRKNRSSLISDNVIPAAAKPPAPSQTTSTAAPVTIDDSLLNQEEDPFEALRDINNLVTLNQGFIEQENRERVLQMFRPDLLEFVPKFNENAVEQLAHRILESIIMRHRRQLKEITADQFNVQDKRLNEIERATFARRYMPSANKINSPRIREIVGRAYDLQGQSELQKEFLGEAEDWMDVSLRNAKDVMSVKTALE